LQLVAVHNTWCIPLSATYRLLYKCSPSHTAVNHRLMSQYVPINHNAHRNNIKQHQTTSNTTYFPHND
jgi:hypothetical protein